MTWTSRDFRSFPARFPIALRSAAASHPKPHPFGAFRHLSEANSEMELFRKYRYCLKHQPGVDFTLDHIISQFRFRVTKSFNLFGDTTLELHAIALTLPDLISLNPQIADLIRSECQ